MTIKKAALLEMLEAYNGINNECVVNINLIKATINSIPDSEDLGGLVSINNFIANGKAYETNLNQGRDIAQELHEIFTELTTFVNGMEKREKLNKHLEKAKKDLAETNQMLEDARQRLDQTDKNMDTVKQKTIVQDSNRHKRHISNIIFIALIAATAITAVVLGVLELCNVIDTNDIVGGACGLLDLFFGVFFFIYEIRDDNKAKNDIEDTRQGIESVKTDVRNVNISISMSDNYGEVKGYTENN